MATGSIKKLTDKGFGFILPDDGSADLFFHMSAIEGTTFEQLREGNKVTYESSMGPKGPKAEKVTLMAA